MSLNLDSVIQQIGALATDLCVEVTVDIGVEALEMSDLVKQQSGYDEDVFDCCGFRHGSLHEIQVR